MESIASVVAPIATTIAALITASNLGARITGYGFIVFTIGSIAWTALGYLTGQPNLLWQNVILTGLNLFGVWRWLGRQSKIEDGAMAAAEASEGGAGESLFPVSLMTKARVEDGEGRELGFCVDAMAGCDSGRIHYIMVSEGGVAGVGESLRRLEWSEACVRSDKVVTRLGQHEFCALQTISKDEWPAA
jgi:hypothetical protein